MNNNVQSVLQENRLFPPSAAFSAQANINAEQAALLHEKAETDYEGFWADLAREFLTWHTPFQTVLDERRAPHYAWFNDGTLNASYNCLDRHIEAGKGDKTAIIFESDDGQTTHYTYQQLFVAVNRFANALQAQGVNQGDRVVIYLPMSVQGVIAMQACARIGAIHSVVFGGFSAEALRDRVNDAGAKVIITADAGVRGGKTVALKQAVDQALDAGCESVERVIVYQRTGQAVPMVEGRDLTWDEALAGQYDYCAPVWVNA
ncbi:MAG TPA: acetyl-coenzyme A synthetase, partial [Thiothrix sp.]|nr:acetyl-coenzyme A synthetase [Thiothrix sp.]